MKEQESNKGEDQANPGHGTLPILPKQQRPDDTVSKPLLAEVSNKEPFGPPRVTHITGKRVRGNARLTSWVID